MDQGTHEAAPPIVWASDALLDVAAERRRQIEAEGWTPERDDEHADGSMAKAAACYALGSEFAEAEDGMSIMLWPWEPRWWKPRDARSNLVRAAALLVAEIERLDRATA